MRISGLLGATNELQVDWLILACAPKIRKIVEKVALEEKQLGAILRKIEILFPKIENDLSLRTFWIKFLLFLLLQNHQM